MISTVNVVVKNSVKVYTLGHFSIFHDEAVISEKAGRSKKLWDLLKYFLTYRGRYMHPESIIENLWPEQEYLRPKSVLHDYVYRLRQLFEQEFISEIMPFYIECSQGCYHFKLDENCWLDTDIFISLSQNASKLAHHSPDEALEMYRNAISLYQGEYLPQHRENWLLPARRYYRGIYLQNVLELTKLLKAKHSYQEINALCENAFQIDSFIEKEELHLLYMEALAEQGKTGDALSHYEFITSLLYHEIGAKPSAAMRDRYRMLKEEAEDVELKLSSIRDKLMERQETKGAFLCDRDFFRLLYRMQVRRCNRTDQKTLLGLLTITRQDYGLPEKEILTRAAAKLEKVLTTSLRSGDAFCQWNQAQFLILLPGYNFEHAENLLKRLERTFLNRVKEDGITLRGQVQKVLPWT